MKEKLYRLWSLEPANKPTRKCDNGALISMRASTAPSSSGRTLDLGWEEEKIPQLGSEWRFKKTIHTALGSMPIDERLRGLVQSPVSKKGRQQISQSLQFALETPMDCAQEFRAGQKLATSFCTGLEKDDKQDDIGCGPRRQLQIARKLRKQSISRKVCRQTQLSFACRTLESF